MAERLALAFFASLAFISCSACAQRTEQRATESAENFSFALVADVQYARKPDDGLRRYRSSLERLAEAVTDWSDEDLAFTVQLGDIIDGAESPQESFADLEEVLKVFSAAPKPLRHVIGNHCLELPRASLQERLQLIPTWYSFRRGNWRFLVVDSLWEALSGREPDDPIARAAQIFLDTHKFAPEARPWNGGLGPVQRAWLRDELTIAESLGEHVVVFSHLPVLKASAKPLAVLWDHREVLSILEQAPAFHAWIAGHHHAGGYAKLGDGHYLTLPGMLEARAGTNAYAVVHAEAGGLVIDGRGAIEDQRLDLAK